MWRQKITAEKEEERENKFCHFRWNCRQLTATYNNVTQIMFSLFQLVICTILFALDVVGAWILGFENPNCIEIEFANLIPGPRRPDMTRKKKMSKSFVSSKWKSKITFPSNRTKLFDFPLNYETDFERQREKWTSETEKKIATNEQISKLLSRRFLVLSEYLRNFHARFFSSFADSEALIWRQFFFSLYSFFYSFLLLSSIRSCACR